MLDSVRILDLIWVLGGPFAGQTLAQLGADVIKIEPPEGDMSRTIPPHFHAGDSSFFLSVNRGKRGISLDLKHPDGLAVFYDLVRHCDVVIYGFAPDVPKRLGIDFTTLKAVNERICVGELIGLHDEGPFARAPAFDIIVQALSGIMSITGDGREPCRVGYQIADLAGGLYLALGVTGALVKALRSNQGAHVQLSLLDCQLALLTWQAQNYFISGEQAEAMGSRSPMIAPSEAFACRDGRYLAISPTGQQFWQQFCASIDNPALASDSRFATPGARIANVTALADDWANSLQGAHRPNGRIISSPPAFPQPRCIRCLRHWNSRSPLSARWSRRSRTHAAKRLCGFSATRSNSPAAPLSPSLRRLASTHARCCARSANMTTPGLMS